ncbi:MAG: hypothetical protein DMF56_27220 [Acidobacteria bacterium]|nr:MAG: hypothetical protein DMF56_27220 [Acidobacteriota bacterium]
MRGPLYTPSVTLLLLVLAILSTVAVLNTSRTTLVLTVPVDEVVNDVGVVKRWQLVPNATSPPQVIEGNIPTAFAQIDSRFRQFASGTGAFVAPDRMVEGDTARVVARLARAMDADDILKGLPPGVIRQWREARITPVMKARLSGVGFIIQNVSSEEQLIGGGKHTEWNWLVTPQQPGERELVMQITAVLSVGGFEKTRDVLVQTHHIHVSVSPRLWTQQFLDNYGGKAVAFVVGMAFLEGYRKMMRTLKRRRHRKRSRIVPP